MAARGFILAFAGAIDALEAILVMAMTALGSTAAGAVGGAAAGAAACSGLGATAANACGAVGAALGGYVGFLAQGTGAGEAIGFMLGYVMSICISLSFGVMLVTILIFMRRFKGLYTGYVFLLKLIPVIGVAPGWFVYAWKCTTKVEGAEQKKETPKPQTSRTPSVAFDGIRAAQSAAVVLALVFLAHSGSAYAQTLPAPIQYVVTPEAPGPNQQVTIEAQGVGSFLGSANLTWTQDGKVVEDAVGARAYTFTTGSLGQKTTVRVSIDSSQGAFAQTFTFNPSLINLVWEADTSVPMLYKGKALYSAGSDYKVLALPSVYSGGAKVSAGALSYQWSRADNPIPEQSGFGRSVLSLTGDQLQSSEDIMVDVYYGNVLAGSGAIAIPATAPQIVLYQRDALRGVLYDAALPAGISLAAPEITVQAEPFYFANKALRSGLAQYTWTLNDAETAGPDSAQGILTLRQTGSGTGQALLGVSMQNNNADQFVQTASATLQLVFGAQTGNAVLNFFGL